MQDAKGTSLNQLEGIEYHGIAGASLDCQEAVMRLLQFGDHIIRTRIISASKFHCLLLTKENGDVVAIKSGFASGYGGEGPTRFSISLQLLKEHGSEIDECEVDEGVIERLDKSALTTAEFKEIMATRAIRPSRWPDYLLEKHYGRTIWEEFPPVIPFAIIDDRIMDLALSFWDEPDDKLLKGYRRLEDIVRALTGLTEHGAKLFSKAFGTAKPCLTWEKTDEGEKQGRINLFAGAYMAHRNPRAHQELAGSRSEQLAEFLLLNHLYRLEAESTLNPPSAPYHRGG